MNKEQLYEHVKSACANGSPGVGKRVALLDEFRKNGLTPRDLDEMIDCALAELPPKAKETVNPGYTISAPYIGHHSIDMPPRVEINSEKITIEPQEFHFKTESVSPADVPQTTEEVAFEFESVEKPVAKPKESQHKENFPEWEEKTPQAEKSIPKPDSFSEEELRRSKESLENIKQKIADTKDLPNHPHSTWVYNLGLVSLICAFVFPALALITAVITVVLRSNIKNYKGTEAYNVDNVLVKTGLLFVIGTIIIVVFRKIVFGL